MENETQEPLLLGDKVRKVKGYRFPGVVVAVITTLSNKTRYVVECTTPGCEGMLHIFNRDQLVKNTLELHDILYPLSVRARNVVLKTNVRSVSDLRKLSKKDLMLIKYCGACTATEIELAMEKAGFPLAAD